jgi:hypothetical protein
LEIESITFKVSLDRVEDEPLIGGKEIRIGFQPFEGRYYPFEESGRWVRSHVGLGKSPMIGVEFISLGFCQ